MGEPIGTELDGRLFTDLSTLTPEHPVTPTKHFFVRTRASKLLDTSPRWTIQVGGLISKPISIPANSLAARARPAGVHLMECSGNTRAAHFGMMSAAEWDGVPLQEVLESIKPKVPGARVLVSGFDQYKSEPMTSVPGASWIFSLDQLVSAGAFLATKMNGQPLSPDHGAPVRLLVPGWYGCVCIKWVNQIDFVPDDAPATSQMQEYAGRTSQEGVPFLAREYRPATAAAAATPVRIEKWRIGGKIRYRVIGITWGGPWPRWELEIRFNPEEEFVPVEKFDPPTGDSWGFWYHTWTPPRTGAYRIRLRPKANHEAERMESGYYDRSVEIAAI